MVPSTIGSTSARLAVLFALACSAVTNAQQITPSQAYRPADTTKFYKVDVAKATWTNTIGAPELGTVWTDPEFDPAQRAFYHARVIEIPTTRWTAYDAAYFKVKMDANVPMITVERAFTSPIWYTPK